VDESAAREELASAVLDPEGAASELASELSTFRRERQGLRDTTSWLVQLDLGEEELEFAIQKKSIKDVHALRLAIADACISSQGAKQTPRKWQQREGRARGMQIQYLDHEDEFKTLASPTAFKDARSSMRLHVMPT